VTVFLAAAKPVPVRQAHNLEDFGARLSWSTPSHSKTLTRADLEKMGVEWAHEAVVRAAASFHQTGDATIDYDCAVIVNGGPETVTLSSLTVDEIETVEVYGSSRSPMAAGHGRGTAPSRPSIPIVPLTNTHKAAIRNATRRCPLVYVWLRG